jgi:predicted glycoside hydrolase/deacetylase ChbG (UPF0249 family)
VAIKPIVVCADDFGLAPGVSDGIAGLIDRGRLSATSAMTILPTWRSHGAVLQAVVARSPADVGLHLTLTDQPALTSVASLAPGGRFPGVNQVLRDALRGRWYHNLEEAILRDEVRAQLDAFEDVWGRPPDYVDGHQHVHILPGIRGVLLGELQLRYDRNPARPVYLRNCGESVWRIARRGGEPSKAVVLSLLSTGFARAARAEGFATNDGFSGLHDFSGREPFGVLMHRFLAFTGPRHLMHVHPGFVDAELRSRDTLTTQREAELAYLASDEFLDALAAAGVQVARFASLHTQATRNGSQD